MYANVALLSNTKATNMLSSELFREVNEWQTAEMNGRTERGDI
jgi:hypothetical protein